MTQQQFLEEYASLPEEARRQVADYVTQLRQRYLTAHQSGRAEEIDFEKEPFFGMWSDRKT